MQKHHDIFVDCVKLLSENATPADVRGAREQFVQIVRERTGDEEYDVARPTFTARYKRYCARRRRPSLVAHAENQVGEMLKPKRHKHWSKGETRHLANAYKETAEDRKLNLLLNSEAFWTRIGLLLGRTGDECKLKWIREYRKGERPWTEEEDLNLQALYAQHGERWHLYKFIGRTAKAVKTRAQIVLNKNGGSNVHAM